MLVEAPKTMKEVTEYVFTFNSGMELSFVVDERAGDTVAKGDREIRITLTPKANPMNPEEIAPGEEIEINRSTLACTQVRKRHQRLPTVDELIDMQKILHKVPKAVQ